MAKVSEIYKCNGCGLIVEVLHGGVGNPMCCGEEMALLKAKTEDAATEKHVPFITKCEDCDGFKVTVGQNAAHPMADDHYIEFIELIADGKVYRQQLKPGMAPEACFCVCAETVSAREYCNKHGLWAS